jgi:alkylated DNA repair dioxygenase AlkB
VHNLLPKDGEVFYWSEFLNSDMADSLFRQLLENIDWSKDKVKLFGKIYITEREVAWYADDDLSYTYSGEKKVPKAWSAELLNLKHTIEEATGETFNACLLNLYHSGNEGMGWHSDDEPELGYEPVIASLSLGAKRKFAFKHKHDQLKYSLELEHGSLLLMKGRTQHDWKHALPKSKKVGLPRINLTFRKILVLKAPFKKSQS